MPIETLIALIIAILIINFAPGPSVITTTKILLTYGVHNKFLFVCRTLLGNLVFILALLVGLTVVRRVFHEIFFNSRSW